MPSVSTSSVAAELRAVMGRKDITATELAERAGRTPMWVSRRLRGVTPLSVDDVALLADALEVSPLEVLAAPAPTP